MYDLRLIKINDLTFLFLVTPPGELWLCVYVDDVSVAASNDHIYHWFVNQLERNSPSITLRLAS